MYDIDGAVANGNMIIVDPLRARQVGTEGAVFHASRLPGYSAKHLVGVLVFDGGCIVHTLQGARIIDHLLRSSSSLNRHIFEHRRLQVATRCFP